MRPFTIEVMLTIVGHALCVWSTMSAAYVQDLSTPHESAFEVGEIVQGSSPNVGNGKCRAWAPNKACMNISIKVHVVERPTPHFKTC